MIVAFASACSNLEIPPTVPTPDVPAHSPWLLYEMQGRDLLIGVELACETLDRVAVSETREAVEILALTSSPADRECFLAVASELRRVTLAEPLGDRALTGCRLEEDQGSVVRNDCAEIVTR
ncbi:MAG TPA: hypothetical protein VHR55_01575 [Candidatus Limnocylindria bacterium]|nr:hypothetical protein [Candidatus Limnocylindria bacterium]